MVRIAVLSVVLLLMLAPSGARAEFYKWVDREGREFITNDREKIPAEHRAAAKPVEVGDDRVSVGQGPVADKSRPVKPLEHKDKYGRGEEYWRKRAEHLRRELREQEDERLLLVKQGKADDADPRKSASSKKKAKSSRDKKMAKVDKNIAKLKRELEVDLPEVPADLPLGLRFDIDEEAAILGHVGALDDRYESLRELFQDDVC